MVKGYSKICYSDKGLQQASKGLQGDFYMPLQELLQAFKMPFKAFKRLQVSIAPLLQAFEMCS